MKLEDKLYTSTEVADILGVSLRSVYRYLEEGKLDADIKTATGRHRFTKDNIVNFLYPDGVIETDSETSKIKVSAKSGVSKDYIDTDVQQNIMDEEDKYDIDPYVMEEDTDIYEEVTVDNSDNELVGNNINDDEPVDVIDEEEEVDWLAKFRAAAEKHRKAQEQQTDPVQTEDNLSTLVDQNAIEEVEEKPEVISDIYYYKSGVGGLRELAQYINKTARKSNLPYAFTMNSGLSLHKLIRPFSMLHIYVKENDKEFFERALELTESDQDTAQLCIFVDKEGVLKDRKEIHSLYVVSDLQLRKDLLDNGETDLASELDDIE